VTKHHSAVLVLITLVRIINTLLPGTRVPGSLLLEYQVIPEYQVVLYYLLSLQQEEVIIRSSRALPYSLNDRTNPTNHQYYKNIDIMSQQSHQLLVRSSQQDNDEKINSNNNNNNNNEVNNNDDDDDDDDEIMMVELVSLPPTSSPYSQEIKYTIDQFSMTYNNNNNNNNDNDNNNQNSNDHAHRPWCVARAPGRVNIIGEHIDYNGFSVLPMALQQSIYVAADSVSSSSSSSTAASASAAVIGQGANQDNSQDCIELEMQSTSPQAVPRRYAYPVDELVVENFSIGDSNKSAVPLFDVSNEKDWSHYVLSAFFGTLEGLLEEQSQIKWKDRLRGQRFRLLVHGTVPQGAGVSSSSALVVSSSLAILTLIHKLRQQDDANASHRLLPLSRPQIANLCARCERYVGTEGGGMDQAIALFAQAGSGCYIQFQPSFCHRLIPLPEGASWIVCHSLEESHKRHDAATLFNKRVVECKIGCRLLADAINWTDHHNKNYPTSLWELVSKTGMSLVELEKIVTEDIAECYSKKELNSLILQASEMDTETPTRLAAELGITRQAGIHVLELADSFFVRDRILHVLSETRRVQEFVSLVSSQHETNQGSDYASPLQSMGILMNNSHRSCSKLYDCSSAQVDKLHLRCLAAPGTLGSRMTGAGWGGCVISLVKTVQVKDFCDYIHKHYYQKLPVQVTGKRSKSDYLFVTRPSQGSEVYLIEY